MHKHAAGMHAQVTSGSKLPKAPLLLMSLVASKFVRDPAKSAYGCAGAVHGVCVALHTYACGGRD